MIRTSHRLGAASLLVLAGLATTPASATGTASGSTITNNVSVAYNVGGVAQTAVTASDTFTVDRRVNVTVTATDTSTVSVSPGQTSAVTTFQVTNLSNATLDFALAVTQQIGGPGGHSNTDNFDVTNLKIYADTNNSGGYDAGDVQITYLDELAADTSKTVFVLADIPIGRANGDVAAVTLTAVGRESGTAGSLGAVLVQSVVANTAGVDTVFADGAGAIDLARDAAFSARDDYTVLGATLSVMKVSRIVSDPLNGAVNPKFIPGATVEYCISVANAAGGAPATGVAVSDLLPTTTTYLSSYGILVNGTKLGSICNLDGTSGGTFAAGSVSATIPTVAPGDTRTVVFRVTIN